MAFSAKFMKNQVIFIFVCLVVTIRSDGITKRCAPASGPQVCIPGLTCCSNTTTCYSSGIVPACSVYRDFNSTFSDMGGTIAYVTGEVASVLGSDKMPTNGTHPVHDLYAWYHNTTSSVYHNAVTSVVFQKESQGVWTLYARLLGYSSGEILESSNFFPLDYIDTYPKDYDGHDFYFTLALSVWYTTPYTTCTPTVHVRSDDDLFVFSNGTLVIDNGGIHAEDSSDIIGNLVHATSVPLELMVFYAERHTVAAALSLSIQCAELQPSCADLGYNCNDTRCTQYENMCVSVNDCYNSPVYKNLTACHYIGCTGGVCVDGGVTSGCCSSSSGVAPRSVPTGVTCTTGYCCFNSSSSTLTIGSCHACCPNATDGNTRDNGCTTTTQPDCSPTTYTCKCTPTSCTVSPNTHCGSDGACHQCLTNTDCGASTNCLKHLCNTGTGVCYTQVPSACICGSSTNCDNSTSVCCNNATCVTRTVSTCCSNSSCTTSDPCKIAYCSPSTHQCAITTNSKCVCGTNTTCLSPQFMCCGGTKCIANTTNACCTNSSCAHMSNSNVCLAPTCNTVTHQCALTYIPGCCTSDSNCTALVATNQCANATCSPTHACSVQQRTTPQCSNCIIDGSTGYHYYCSSATPCSKLPTVRIPECAIVREFFISAMEYNTLTALLAENGVNPVLSPSDHLPTDNYGVSDTLFRNPAIANVIPLPSAVVFYNVGLNTWSTDSVVLLALVHGAIDEGLYSYFALMAPIRYNSSMVVGDNAVLTLDTTVITTSDQLCTHIIYAGSELVSIWTYVATSTTIIPVQVTPITIVDIFIVCPVGTGVHPSGTITGVSQLRPSCADLGMCCNGTRCGSEPQCQSQADCLNLLNEMPTCHTVACVRGTCVDGGPISGCCSTDEDCSADHVCCKNSTENTGFCNVCCGRSHITVSGINAGDVAPVLVGEGDIVVINNGSHVAATETGPGIVYIINNGAAVTATETGLGTIYIINNGGVLTATNTGNGLMTIDNTCTATVTITNTGNGNITVHATGTSPITLTYSDGLNHVYPELSPSEPRSLVFTDYGCNNVCMPHCSASLSNASSINTCICTPTSCTDPNYPVCNPLDGVCCQCLNITDCNYEPSVCQNTWCGTDDHLCHIVQNSSCTCGSNVNCNPRNSKCCGNKTCIPLDPGDGLVSCCATPDCYSDLLPSCTVPYCDPDSNICTYTRIWPPDCCANDSECQTNDKSLYSYCNSTSLLCFSDPIDNYTCSTCVTEYTGCDIAYCSPYNQCSEYGVYPTCSVMRELSDGVGIVVTIIDPEILIGYIPMSLYGYGSIPYTPQFLYYSWIFDEVVLPGHQKDILYSNNTVVFVEQPNNTFTASVTTALLEDTDTWADFISVWFSLLYNPIPIEKGTDRGCIPELVVSWEDTNETMLLIIVYINGEKAYSWGYSGANETSNVTFVLSEDIYKNGRDRLDVLVGFSNATLDIHFTISCVTLEKSCADSGGCCNGTFCAIPGQCDVETTNCTEEIKLPPCHSSICNSELGDCMDSGVPTSECCVYDLDCASSGDLPMVCCTNTYDEYYDLLVGNCETCCPNATNNDDIDHGCFMTDMPDCDNTTHTCQCTNTSCSIPTPYCDITDGRCKACLSDANCISHNPCYTLYCSNTSFSCVAKIKEECICGTTMDCNPETQICCGNTTCPTPKGEGTFCCNVSDCGECGVTCTGGYVCAPTDTGDQDCQNNGHVGEVCVNYTCVISNSPSVNCTTQYANSMCDSPNIHMGSWKECTELTVNNWLYGDDDHYHRHPHYERSENCNQSVIVGCSLNNIPHLNDTNIGCDYTTVCDDHNPCTTDKCDLFHCHFPGSTSIYASTCLHEQMKCQHGFRCDSSTGLCTIPACEECDKCDDGDLCTIDAFDPTTRNCTHTLVDCDDHNLCTHDTCVRGSCLHKVKQCLFPDLCDSGQCNPQTGRCEVTNRTVCPEDDDEDDCTHLQCVDGQCVPSAVECGPKSHGVCASVMCVAGVCVDYGQPLCVLNASQLNSSPCGEVVCDERRGGCHVIHHNCDDQNPCTTDSCSRDTVFTCVHMPVNCTRVLTDRLGRPLNPLTEHATCSKNRGGCVLAQQTDACDDGRVCTIDAIDETTHICTHTPVDCGCTSFVDPCVECGCSERKGGCWVGMKPQCLANMRPKELPQSNRHNEPANPCPDDGNPCTVEKVDKRTGKCVSEFLCTAMKPRKCTTVKCERLSNTSAVCTRIYDTCDDLNPCTIDSCSPKDGCVHAPKFCAAGSHCNNTTGLCDVEQSVAVDPCVAYEISACVSCEMTPSGCVCTTNTCDDSDSCTTDTCNKTTGMCSNVPITCESHHCSISLGCSLGSCRYEEETTCATLGPNFYCNYTTGECTEFRPVTQVGPCVPADAQPCTLYRVLVPGGACVSVGTDPCNDGNKCTVDTCRTSDSTCEHTPVVCNASQCDEESGICLSSEEYTESLCGDTLCRSSMCKVAMCDYFDHQTCIKSPVLCFNSKKCNDITGECA